MKVTRVKIFEGKGNILANMNITLDDCLAVNGIKVIEGTKGRFISFPQTSYKVPGYRLPVHERSPCGTGQGADEKI